MARQLFLRKLYKSILQYGTFILLLLSILTMLHWAFFDSAFNPVFSDIKFSGYNIPSPVILNTSQNLDFNWQFRWNRRDCSLTFNRYIVSAEQELETSQNFTGLTAASATSTITPLTAFSKYLYFSRVVVDIPDNLTPGFYYYQSRIHYVCNPIHSWFPSHYYFLSPKAFFKVS